MVGPGRSDHAAEEVVAVDQLVLEDQPDVGGDHAEEGDVTGDVDGDGVVGHQHQPQAGQAG